MVCISASRLGIVIEVVALLVATADGVDILVLAGGVLVAGSVSLLLVLLFLFLLFLGILFLGEPSIGGGGILIYSDFVEVAFLLATWQLALDSFVQRTGL